ncbi:thiaminase II [Rugosimonospora acidiphila]|uniref:Thiaminase II n=1 Tax=Rugosimonospora acidiphila TaxID=556531 RepID=A0ABP9RVV5_9ACTN
MTGPNQTPLSTRLWSDCSAIYAQITAHPFITGLVDGTLGPERFGHYLAQDAHYLREYARALMLVGAKAPTSADVAMLARHAANTIEVELALRATTLPTVAVDPVAVAGPLPTTRAYLDHLLAVARGGTFLDGLAAVLPCYVIYGRLGTDLADRVITQPLYREWVDSYAAGPFAEAIREVVALVDRVGAQLSAEAEQRARAHFVASARYEWAFWDAAYRLERPAP